MYPVQMRRFARKYLLDMLGMFAHPTNGIHILNGHMIDRHAVDSNAQQHFHGLLEELTKECKFIHIEDAVEMIWKRQIANCPVVAFTFDDGFTDCIDFIAPVLEDFGVNAAFFINPNFVDGDEPYIRDFTENIVLTPGKQPMRWDAIKNLHDRGHIIGAHTMDHYMINTDDRKELEYQIGFCRREIENQLGVPCEWFAFPYGRLEHANRMAIDIACEHYKYVFSQSDHKHYFSFDERVINRRHFEPFWPVSHVRYFLSCRKR